MMLEQSFKISITESFASQFEPRSLLIYSSKSSERKTANMNQG